MELVDTVVLETTGKCLAGSSPARDTMIGKKDSKTEKKPNIFTYCKVNKEAITALAERMQMGHEKYEEGLDYENFKRVEDADFEYSNAMFRHALEIGEDSKLEHYVAQAWNAVSRLQIYLEQNETNKTDCYKSNN